MTWEREKTKNYRARLLKYRRSNPVNLVAYRQHLFHCMEGVCYQYIRFFRPFISMDSWSRLSRPAPNCGGCQSEVLRAGLLAEVKDDWKGDGRIDRPATGILIVGEGG